MGRNRGGYTIIEVMIVIAITGLLFISAILVFHGEQGRTGFSQAMQDISTKIQNYASQISSGTYAGSSNYSCDASSGTPVLKSSPAALPAAAQCVFVGRVFQANQGSNTLKSFVVVGTRDNFNGGASDSGQVAENVAQTNPQLANISNSPVMEDDYGLTNNTTIASSMSGNQTYELVGMFDDLQASAGAPDSTADNLLLNFYNCNSGNGCSSPRDLINCIDTNRSGCGSTALTMSQWTLCIHGTNSQSAQLEVDDTSSGITTKTNFTSC